MEEQNTRLRQEAAEIVISECKQWLIKIMEEEIKKIGEEINQITKSRLTVEQIAASFEEDTRRITEGEPEKVAIEFNSVPEETGQTVVMARR